MGSPAYRIGAAAKQLGISEHHLRRLCEAGLVSADRSEGGHWHISLQEIDRLRREGIPDIPSSLPADRMPVAVIEPTREPTSGTFNEPPRASRRVSEARDDVEVSKQLLERRRVELDLLEAEDALEDRRRRKQAEKEAESRLREEQAAVEKEAARRRKWMDQWVEYGLGQIPGDLGPGIVSEVQDVLDGVLSQMDCDRDEYLVRKRVRDEVELAVAGRRRLLAKERHIEAASNRLDVFARNLWTPTEWEIRARNRAAEAVGKLRPDASMAEIAAVTQQAGDEVNAEFLEERRKRMGS